MSADSERTLRSLKEGVESYARGQLPHAKHVISTLYKLMENDEPIEESSFPGATLPNQRPPSAGCAGLQKALTSSLTSGTFLDSQFYAVESRSSSGLPKIRPIYFCSMAGGGFVPKLMACKSLLEITRGQDIDLSSQVLQGSMHGKCSSDPEMAMTATSRTGAPARGVPWPLTRA